MAVPRVGAAVCMRDAASEGVVARVDASTVRVECAWGSAEFPAPSPAPAVGGAVALPGPCAGVVVQIEGDAVVVRAAWGSWRAAWARVGARGFGPPGTRRVARSGRRGGRACSSAGARPTARTSSRRASTRDLRSSLATALEADDVEAELAALARRKSGEAADIYEATARDAESRTGALATLMGAEVGADNRGDALKAKAREVARRREQAARRRRCFDDARAREFLVPRRGERRRRGRGRGGRRPRGGGLRAGLAPRGAVRGLRAPPTRADARARPSPRPWRPPGLRPRRKLASTSPSPRTPTRARSRAATASVDELVATPPRRAESGDDLARRAATLALGYAGGGDHNALGALLAESPLKSALEDVAGSGGVAPRAAADGDAAVDGVRRVADASASLLETLSALNRDERVMHFAQMATDDDGVRDALDAVNDAALGFLLRHLPAMPVPPVDVESDNVDYFLDNLNLSQLRIDENDVTVDVASSDGSRVVRKGVGLRAGGDDADGGGGARVALKAVRISATFPNLTWRFRQKQFPFLEAEGRADVAVADASVALALSARRRNSESGDPEPVVALTRCDVAIDDLELTMDEHRFSWVFNSLAGLFRDQIRDYVCEALRDLVVDKSRDLLEPINALLGASWAPLRRALDLPDVCDLPRLEGDCAAGDVDVTLRAPGPLGLELAQHPDDPRHLAVAGLVAGGQCAAALAQQGFSADDVAGARLVSVDGADARDLARDDTVVRVTSPARPRPQNLADRGFAPGLALVAVGDAAVSPRTDAVADVAAARGR
ncbi:hypothetical protein JL720_3658 [Aureococcus anophagefferens]|nr:hypothetical protein JL720_3658 [Aureococcus anophagefferens]